MPENDGVISLIANFKILHYTVQPHYLHKYVFKSFKQNIVVIDTQRCIDLLMLAYTSIGICCVYICSCIAYHDVS